MRAGKWAIGIVVVLSALVDGCASYRASFHAEEWVLKQCSKAETVTPIGNEMVIADWVPDGRLVCVAPSNMMVNREPICVTVREMRKWVLDVKRVEEHDETHSGK